MKTHPLFTSLKNLTGNPRGCVYPEPLWGIPYNLYFPYASIYMVAIGLADTQIGLIVSISWFFQIILALFSGVITDKLGRRLTTLIFDIFAWSIPALISALAQNFWFFLASSVLNSVWRITQNSWTCLLVEDANPREIVDIYTWIYIANQLSGLAAPVAGILISEYSLVPTVRGLYYFAAVMFAVKAIVTYLLTEETQQGKIRIQETHLESPGQILSGYIPVLKELLHTPQTLYTAGILLMISITNMISGSFWSILVTEKLNISAESLSIFPFLKSAIILLFFFTIMPIFKRMHFRRPMMIGFFTYILSVALLILTPQQNYFLLILSVILEACAFAAVTPLLDQMVALTINPQERARIQSIMYVGIISLTSPFGWIAGVLSDMNKNYPFILNIALFTLGAFLVSRASKHALEKQALQEERSVPLA